MSPPQEYEARFISALVRLAPKDLGGDASESSGRAALAALRRGLGKPAGQVVEMYRYVMPHVPPQAKPWQEDAYFVVAALFASHPLNWSDRDDHYASNLGASFLRLRQVTDSDSVEKRFVALLDSPSETLPDHLRQAISLFAAQNIRAQEIRVNYSQLLRDIQMWARDDRKVQRAWARAYWGGAAQSDTGVASAPDQTATETAE